MILTTERLRLEAVDRATWADLLAGRFGPAVDGYPTEGDLMVASLVVDGSREAGIWGPWQVVELASGRIVGGVGFKGAPGSGVAGSGVAGSGVAGSGVAGSGAGVVEIGYGFPPSVHGRGFATEAVIALLECAFARGVYAVVAETDLDNDPSIAVLRRAGFVESHRTPDAVWWERTRVGTSRA